MKYSVTNQALLLYLFQCVCNRCRLLSRRDIEVVVEHGTPFLFQNAEDSARKMRSFISNNTTTVSAECPFSHLGSIPTHSL